MDDAHAPDARGAGTLAAVRARIAPLPASPRRRPRVGAAAVLGVLVVVVGGALAAVRRSGPAGTEIGPEPTVARSVATTAATEPATLDACGRPAPPPPALDVDGDGCPDALRYADGVLTAGADRYALGRPGDALLTGDWACTGKATVALFRPATGALFRFDTWAAPGVDLTVAATAVVPGATGAHVVDVDGDHCDEVVVTRRAGGPTVVRLTGGGARPRSPTTAPPP